MTASAVAFSSSLPSASATTVTPSAAAIFFKYSFMCFASWVLVLPSVATKAG